MVQVGALKADNYYQGLVQPALPWKKVVKIILSFFMR